MCSIFGRQCWNICYMREEIEWSFDGKLCQEYLYEKWSQFDHLFSFAVGYVEDIWWRFLSIWHLFSVFSFCQWLMASWIENIFMKNLFKSDDLFQVTIDNFAGIPRFTWLVAAIRPVHLLTVSSHTIPAETTGTDWPTCRRSVRAHWSTRSGAS